MSETMEKLLRLWDDVDSAAQRVLTALPHQMTEAAARLDEQRRLFRTALTAAALSPLVPEQEVKR